MSVIRVYCEPCELDAHLNELEITLRICRQTLDAEYRYRCPNCQLTQVKTAHPRVGELLVQYGVVTEWFDLPLELDELKPHPPITWDDVLDAHLELEQL